MLKEAISEATKKLEEIRDEADAYVGRFDLVLVLLCSNAMR